VRVRCRVVLEGSQSPACASVAIRLIREVSMQDLI
jgi:hypothetical protein